MKKEKICDICGAPFKRGISVRTILDGVAPWKTKAYICEKCENVIKLMVLQYRKKKGT